MKRDNLFITPPENGVFLYDTLQQNILDSLQSLSGSLWTDYNVHDPGITLNDVLNYSLTEIDYKLGFPLEDYLTKTSGDGLPDTGEVENWGVFTASDVFPVSPVTLEDYRKFFLSRLPEVEDLWIYSSQDTPSFPREGEAIPALPGEYTILVKKETLYPEDLKDLEQKIIQLFNQNRNLCESLKKVTFVAPRKISLHAEIEMEPGYSAPLLMSDIYTRAQALLSGSYKRLTAQDRVDSNTPLDEWLDGPDMFNERLEAVNPDQERTGTALYESLRTLPGITSITSCRLEDQEGNVISVFQTGYMLEIPSSISENHLKFTVNKMPVEVDFEKFLKLFFTNRSLAVKTSIVRVAADRQESGVKAVFHPGLYDHYSITNDMPFCYGLGSQSDSEKKPADPWRIYLMLYDLVFNRGLEELKKLPDLMSLSSGIEQKCLPQERVASLRLGSRAIPELTESSRSTATQKDLLLDMWDSLFGEDSSPVWNDEYNYYGETPDERREARLNFLKKVPEWGRSKSKACDVTGGQSQQNLPGVKSYISTLLSWECDESKPVTNLLPSYNISLVSDREVALLGAGRRMTELNTQDMVGDYELEELDILPLVYDYALYEELKTLMPMINAGQIEEALFRGGVLIENYRLAREAGNPSWKLVFFNKEKRTWYLLETSPEKDKLTRMANLLRLFLIHLNRGSEVMYVVEHQWFPEPEPFTLSIVLSGWSARMCTPRFRQICSNLILSRLPAHLDVKFHWMSLDEMKEFESHWRNWRRSRRSLPITPIDIMDGYMEEIKKLLDKNASRPEPEPLPPYCPLLKLN